jgi:TonB-dependent SusC/RagA subfamily outer membrane receptor
MKFKSRNFLFFVSCISIVSFSPSVAFGLSVRIEIAKDLQKKISGKVYDATGTPLSGVTIINKQSQSSAQSGKDGSFSISAERGQSLHFSFMGFHSQELIVQNQTDITIRLEPDNTNLEEVVVVGYGTQKKVNLTGAVDQVGSEVFEGRPLANVSQMLQGAVPNLNITPADGKPTRAPAFNIRGTTSIGQGGSALILIDGVEGDPSILNPNDIESVSVLKDASSAAIYGSRGTFGVVLITTKRAKEGRSTINYSGGFTSQKPTTLPDFVTDGYIYSERFYEAYNAWNNYSSVPSKLNKTQIFTLEWLEEFRK